MALTLEVQQAVDSWHVVDQRGGLVSALPSEREALAFVAGYRTGRADAAAIVRAQVDQLAKVGGGPGFDR